MTLPAVNITELDGALGVLPPRAGRLYALVGVSDSGPIDTPATFARVKDVVATFAAGPLVEAAAHYIERYGRPVVLVRSGASVLGSYLDAVEAADGEVVGFDDSNVTGDSEITVQTAPAAEPDGAYSVQVLFVLGGTVGVAGIVYQVSLNGGATFGLAQALGTDDEIDLGIGVVLELTTDTINAGDFVTFTTTAPVQASAGELVTAIAGNSVPTLDDTTHPNDDYEVFVRVVSGGTRGVAGITYQWSLDGGRTLSPLTALGTATSIVIPGSGGVKIDLSAGTLVAGDTLAFPTVAPRWNGTELASALDALIASAVQWEIVHVVGAIDPDAFDIVELKITGAMGSGKEHAWAGNTRMPVGAETEANYLASLAAALGSKATRHGDFCAGACKLTSSVTGRKYRRPIAFAVAAREASVSEEINTADINLGPLAGASIRDANGNPDEHDEAINPGLDDARFTVLRTWEGVAGVYVNRPRLFSPEGSDFQLLPHRRVLNLAHASLRAYFVRRLNQPVLVDRTSGFILEAEALEIEAGARAVLAATLLAKPKASGALFTLSRTDNLLSTKTLTGQARVIPLAYPEFIELDLGFYNPALQLQAA
jgi:hypothetical protein